MNSQPQERSVSYCRFCGRDLRFSDQDILPPNSLEVFTAQCECGWENIRTVCCACGSVKLFPLGAQGLLEFRPGHSRREQPDFVLAARRKGLRQGVWRFRFFRTLWRTLGRPTQPIEPVPGARECCICDATWWVRPTRPDVGKAEGIRGVTCQFCGRSFCEQCYGQLVAECTLAQQECPACGESGRVPVSACTGALFWFDWQLVSERESGPYGLYIWRHVLESFSPKRTGFSSGHYAFFVGDCLAQGTTDVQFQEFAEAYTLEEIKRHHPQRCYILGIHGRGPIAFSSVDAHLRRKAVTGYLGMTTCGDVDLRGFSDICGRFSLPFAWVVRGAMFKDNLGESIPRHLLQELGFQVP